MTLINLKNEEIPAIEKLESDLILKNDMPVGRIMSEVLKSEEINVSRRDDQGSQILESQKYSTLSQVKQMTDQCNKAVKN